MNDPAEAQMMIEACAYRLLKLAAELKVDFHLLMLAQLSDFCEKDGIEIEYITPIADKVHNHCHIIIDRINDKKEAK